MINVKGTLDTVGEIAEILGWLVTAFAPSTIDQGITYCRPVIKQLWKSQLPRDSRSTDASYIDFYISYEIHSGGNPTKINGQCWHHMFHNPVVVYGYPILRRPQSQPGLEIPLNVMVALLDEERINTFKNRWYIKGFNAMLVPTKCLDGLLLWHLLLNEDESYVSYLDSKSVEMDDTVSLVELEAHRHVVGWCVDATYHAGECFWSR